MRRPDLVPGVDPFIKDGGLLFLNPAAFATPVPGTFGNLERNAIHGPSFRQIDIFFAKHFSIGGRNDIEFRGEIFNLFNTVNFANSDRHAAARRFRPRPSRANTLQPGQAYTARRPARSAEWLQRSAARSVSARRARCSSRCGSRSNYG